MLRGEEGVKLAFSLHPSAISKVHGGTGLSRHRGINGRGPA